MLFSRSNWIRWTGKGLEFTGKVGHTPAMDEWAAGPGAATVADVATSLSAFGLGSKETRAKEKVVESLGEALKSSESLSTAIDNCAAAFPTRLAALVEEKWEALPHSSDASLRLIPVFYLNAQEKQKWTERFAAASDLQAVAGGPVTIDFFLGEIAAQTTAAYIETAPDSVVKDKPIDKPLQCGEKWIVGYDPQYEWVPASGIDRPGHLYVYSAAGTKSSAKGREAKNARQDASSILLSTKDWLGTLSAEERSAIATLLKV